MIDKVHPLSNVEAAARVTSTRESFTSFTIWMKSLVMQGNGCTVYDENGELVYRIDNYDKKGSDEVYLMDLRGKVLFTILRRAKVFGRWRGFEGDTCENLNKKKPSFEVRKKGEITLLPHGNNSEVSCCKLEASPSKSAFKIIDCSNGVVMAEVKRKQTSSGVLLGDDVLALTVEPQVDHSLVMALVTVYGLMNGFL